MTSDYVRAIWSRDLALWDAENKAVATNKGTMQKRAQCFAELFPWPQATLGERSLSLVGHEAGIIKEPRI